MQASKIFQVASSSEKKPPRFIFQASAAAHVYLSLPPSPCASAHEKYKFTVFVETVTSAREKKKNPGNLDWSLLWVSANVMC